MGHKGLNEYVPLILTSPLCVDGYMTLNMGDCYRKRSAVLDYSILIHFLMSILYSEFLSVSQLPCYPTPAAADCLASNAAVQANAHTIKASKAVVKKKVASAPKLMKGSKVGPKASVLPTVKR